MTPGDRIRAYFEACGMLTAAEISAHFTTEAVIYDSNIRPIRGAAEIGEMWVTVRDRWGGATWSVESIVAADGSAAIEWAMSGTDPDSGRRFTFRGSEHYSFVDTLINEIRQYWTFDASKLETRLVGFDYEEALDSSGSAKVWVDPGADS